MHRHTFRRTAVAGAFALLAAAPLAACGNDALTPLPVQSAGPASATTTGTTPAPAPSPSAASTTAATTPPTSARPGTSPPRTPKAHTTTRKPPRPTTACYGAVRHDLDLRNTELALIKSMCFRAGGVLRLQGIGPGLVTADPQSLVSQNYEAGVVDLRFLRPGTVVVSIPQEEQTYKITVVVIS